MRGQAVKALVPAYRWPDDARPRQAGRTLVDQWLAHWSDRPGEVVLVDGWEPGRTVDGRRLTHRTADLAAVLSEHGVVRGARVAWCARAGLDSAETLLAVLRAGAVLVPLNPASTAAEIDHVVSDAGPLVAIADDAAAFGSSIPVLSVAELAGASAGRTSYVPPETGISDDALIVYTSGTTGRPKGAVHSHASLRAGVEALLQAWAWQPQDRLMLTLPLFHVHGLVAGLFGTLTAGASVTVFDRFDEHAVLDAASRHTMFFGVPTMYHRLDATGQARALARLRLCVSGSAPLAAELWHRFADQGVEILERYGMTETLLTLSNLLVGERRPGAVGFPLPGVEAAVEDPDGEGTGQLLVRGASLCSGYWRRTGETTTDADGWFATGDLASVADDGYITIRGRRTELIITGGHNVYPAEIEAVLARHPGVHEAAVVGVPSEEWGETVEAFVVGEPELDLASLEDLATRELASFKRPRRFHMVEALPRNALGKVVRSDLRSR